MVIAAIAFLAGTTCLQFMPELPQSSGLWVCIPVSIVFFRSKFSPVFFFLFGFGLAWLQAANTLETSLPDEWEGTDLLVQGRVTTVPEKFTQGVRFRYAIEKVLENDSWHDFDLQIRLNWYRSAQSPRPGERWQLRVRLKHPHGFANPGGFDYEGWLYRQRIRATGYVRSSPDNRRLQRAEGYLAERTRERLSQYLDTLVADSGKRALFKALVIGKRDELSPGQWEILRRTGTGHLMAISGLHIGLIAGLVFMATRRVWPMLPGAPAVRLPAPRAAAVSALLAASLYALIAGFSVPTQRALIMVATVCLAQLPDRRSSLAKNVVIAMVVVLACDSATVLSPGFLLSFAAVAFIAYGISGIRSCRRDSASRLRRLVQMQWQLSLGLLPLTVILFQQAAWLSPFANLLAVPWMSFSVVPFAVAGTLTAPVSTNLAAGILIVAQGCLEALWRILDWLASLPGALWLHAPPPVWTWIPGIAGIGLLLAPRGIPARWLGLMFLLPALSCQPERPQRGTAWLTLLDVGQGLATVVETSQHVLVFDSGPRWSTGFDTGRAVIVPFLLSRGWKRVNRLVVSHGDNDHIGGARSLSNRLPVSEIITSVPDKIGWQNALPCQAGESWYWDEVQFRFLHPPEQSAGSDNNRSCVLNVATVSGESILLTGDIEREAEDRLVEESPEDLKATVLVAPHHGSQTSSTPAFVNAVAPDIVLIPAGYRNRFGFPHPEVVERYKSVGARILDSGHSGAIQVRIPPVASPIEATSFRATQRRFWHHETVPKSDRNPYDRHNRP